MKALRSKITEKTKVNMDAICPIVDYEFQKKKSIDRMLSEFCFGMGLSMLESFGSLLSESLLSESLVFSKTEVTGITFYAMSSFLVILTLSYTTGLMENSCKQVAAYGKLNGPKTLKEVIVNAHKLALNSSERKAYADKTFYPTVEAFINTLIMIIARYVLASYSNIVYCLIIDGWKSIKTSVLTDKDFEEGVKEFIIAVGGAMARGGIKDVAKFTPYIKGVIPAQYIQSIKLLNDVASSFLSTGGGELVRVYLGCVWVYRIIVIALIYHIYCPVE